MVDKTRRDATTTTRTTTRSEMLSLSHVVDLPFLTIATTTTGSPRSSLSTKRARRGPPGAVVARCSASVGSVNRYPGVDS